MPESVLLSRAKCTRGARRREIEETRVLPWPTRGYILLSRFLFRFSLMPPSELQHPRRLLDACGNAAVMDEAISAPRSACGRARGVWLARSSIWVDFVEAILAGVEPTIRTTFRLKRSPEAR